MRPTAPGRPRHPRVSSVTVLVAAVLAALALGSTLPAYAGAGGSHGPGSPAGHRAKPGVTKVVSWTTPSSVSSGAPVRTSVVVASPGSDGGRRVSLQRQAGSGWTTLDGATTDARGRATLDWRAPGAAATWVLRVSVARAGAKRPAVSSTRKVSVVGAAPGTPSTPGATGDVVLDQTLALVNQARSQARTCTGKGYPAVGPLRAEGRLARAADAWARRMATEGFFAHVLDGSTPQTRIEALGYRWSTWGENIAAGQTTPEAVVAAWLASTSGHCEAIMNPSYTEIGVGHVLAPGTKYGHYWVLDFARPR